MASAPQVVTNTSITAEDPSLNIGKDRYPKRGMPMPKCTLDSSNLLCSKRLKLDEAQLPSNPEVDYESEDETEQWPGSPSMAIDERLSTLQLLLPQGPKMEDDELLRVLVEYVKELESEIKTFHSSTNGWPNLEQSINDSPLQRRGLCVVPLSTLANAL